MTLAPLIARVRAATGPDRELDVLVCCALRFGNFNHDHLAQMPVRRALQLQRELEEDDHGDLVMVGFIDIPCVTSDLNAVKALAEEKLPGWEMEWHCHGGRFGARFYRVGAPGDYETCPTLALSALAAVLVAVDGGG